MGTSVNLLEICWNDIDELYPVGQGRLFLVVIRTVRRVEVGVNLVVKREFVRASSLLLHLLYLNKNRTATAVSELIHIYMQVTFCSKLVCHPLGFQRFVLSIAMNPLDPNRNSQSTAAVVSVEQTRSDNGDEQIATDASASTEPGVGSEVSLSITFIDLCPLDMTSIPNLSLEPTE